MRVSTEHEIFQKKFVGNIALYQDLKLHGPLFLERNIHSFLSYHYTKLPLRRRSRSPTAMHQVNRGSSCEAEGGTFAASLQRTRTSWSMRQLQESLGNDTEPPVLRIEVKGFREKSGKNRRRSLGPELPSKRAKLDVINAQCALTIWDTRSVRNDFVQQTRRCSIRVEKSPANQECAVIEMDEPFLVRVDELFPRTAAGKVTSGSLDQAFTMQISLLAASLFDTWPPIPLKLKPPRMPIVKENGEDIRLPILTGVWVKLPECPQPGTLLTMAAYQDQKPYKTKFGLIIDASWSSAPSPLAVANGKLRNRSLPPTCPPKPKPISDPSIRQPIIVVRWAFEKSWTHMAAIEFDAYLCPLCERQNFQYVELYHFHLINMHDLFKFTLKTQCTVTGTGRQEIAVDVLVETNNSYREKVASNHISDDREMTWQQPKTIFDLEAFLKGDESWLGKDSRKPNRRLGKFSTEASRSASRDSLKHDTSGLISHRAAKDVPDLTAPTRKKFKVPRAPSGIRFFRLGVKRPLVEGELISESDDEIDERWLLQKHENQIDGLSDVSRLEKAFIRRYDTHMLNEKISSNLHFREALVRFCRQNRIWLQRKEVNSEFHKNLARLLLQGAIEFSLVHDCAEILRDIEGVKINGSMGWQEANPTRSSENVELPGEDSTSRQVSLTIGESAKEERSCTDMTNDYGVCVCGNVIDKLTELVYCSNLDCKAREFHLQCAGLDKRQSRWLCQSCAPQALPSLSSSVQGKQPSSYIEVGPFENYEKEPFPTRRKQSEPLAPKSRSSIADSDEIGNGEELEINLANDGLDSSSLSSGSVDAPTDSDRNLELLSSGKIRRSSNVLESLQRASDDDDDDIEAPKAVRAADRPPRHTVPEPRTSRLRRPVIDYSSDGSSSCPRSPDVSASTTPYTHLNILIDGLKAKMSAGIMVSIPVLGVMLEIRQDDLLSPEVRFDALNEGVRDVIRDHPRLMPLHLRGEFDRWTREKESKREREG